MTTSSEIKKFILVIPFANTSGKANARKLGATWDSNNKVWEVSTTEAKMSQRNLWKFVQEEEENTPVKEVEVERGFPGCAKYGFDHIEKMG